MNNLTFLPSFLLGCCLLLLGQFATAQAPQNGPVQQQGYVLMNQPSKATFTVKYTLAKAFNSSTVSLAFMGLITDGNQLVQRVLATVINQ